MTVHFDCTQCGKCCHNLRLTLSVDEAIVWAGRGHTVQLLAEALPWVSEPDPADPQALHQRDRSFPAISGSVPFRIAVTLVAYHNGPCPHLLPDMRCGNYAGRPRICRIYPLESRPFTAMSPENRLCPPEAWASELPVLERDGAIADPEAARIVADHRQAVLAGVPVLAKACEALGLSSAAFANEGLAVHMPEPLVLSETLRGARDGGEEPAEARPWTLVTNRRPTLTMLTDAGCDAALIRQGPGYLGSFPDEP
ncbi:YkgJ family cysteine cluster protein [Novosphingobium beihaiensis]|uniref:YkgJ family cysteine cluster protein n=1 Tax=Novosphingobium beihaiensis TaxID=2930389 RepID=A0ABT0BS05_9SPHN|nr:YkgJ family cysteine cluster protein [Novosphingobium beihaiensis]MCJ2187850.1 YkgJ family cysteine cluster protein [Novosphingobium beihaiensis]